MSRRMSPKANKFFEHRHVVTFQDTNMVGNVYFSNYFKLMGETREIVMIDHYPEMVDDLKLGFGMATEFAHIDFKKEAFLFDIILVKMSIEELSRTRIQFGFEFINEKTGVLLATGQQAVIWMNQQHRPSIMPDKLFEAADNHMKVFIE